MSSEPGRWRNFRTPYLVGPMDACTDRKVETIVMVFPVQMGKTEVILNFLGYIVDQDPGPTLIVYPSEKEADKVIRNRIHPIFTHSASLRRHLTDRPDDLGLKEMHFDRCTFWSAWSNSPASLASTPCRYVVNDEVDKFPPFAGREANPIKLSEMRTSTYRGRRKMIIVSTPTTEYGNIWQEWTRTNQQEYWVPCALCGGFQVLDFFAGVKWPEGATWASLKDEQNAWYECKWCKGKLQDQQKIAMNIRGMWVPKAVEVSREGSLCGLAPPRQRMGFHISACNSPWMTFSDLASEHLEALGDKGRRMNFTNSRLALPWRENVETVKHVHLLKRVRDYPAGSAPIPGLKLTCGVDVQLDHFWFSVRGWASGEKSWLLRYGSCMTWDDVKRVIRSTYISGNAPAKVQMALIDAHYRKDEVWKFCKDNRPYCFATVGLGGGQIRYASRPYNPAPGVRGITFKADFWKDKLARLIQTADGEPGEWNLHREMTEDYYRQMTAEHRIPIRNYGRTYLSWQKLRDDNHIWDTEVLNVLAADKIGVRWDEDEMPAETSPTAPKSPAQERRANRGEPWLERGTWLGGGSIWDQ